MFGVNVAGSYVLIVEKRASDLAYLASKVLPANKSKLIIDEMLAWTNKVLPPSKRRIMVLQEMGETNVLMFKYLF